MGGGWRTTIKSRSSLLSPESLQKIGRFQCGLVHLTLHLLLGLKGQIVTGPGLLYSDLLSTHLVELGGGFLFVPKVMSLGFCTAIVEAQDGFLLGRQAEILLLGMKEIYRWILIDSPKVLAILGCIEPVAVPPPTLRVMPELQAAGPVGDVFVGGVILLGRSRSIWIFHHVYLLFLIINFERRFLGSLAEIFPFTAVCFEGGGAARCPLFSQDKVDFGINLCEAWSRLDDGF